MQTQWILDVPVEQVQAIEPSRPPEATPCFRTTVGLGQPALARRGREHPFRGFLEQDLVNHFFDAQTTAPVHPPAGHRPPSRRGRSLGLAHEGSALTTELSKMNLRRISRCARRSACGFPRRPSLCGVKEVLAHFRVL